MFEWGEKLPTIQGDGLVLRMLDDADVPALFEIFSDPEVMRYWSWSPFETLGDAERLLDDIRGLFKDRTFTVSKRTPTHETPAACACSNA